MIGMPYFNEPLLSNWDPTLVFEAPRQPQQRIDPDTLAVTSVSGYAPFHKRHPRNFVEKSRGTTDGGAVPAPKFLSQQGRGKNSRNPAEAVVAESILLYGDEAKRQFEVPPMYKMHEIKYSRFGVEDFDFAYGNNSPPPGSGTGEEEEEDPVSDLSVGSFGAHTGSTTKQSTRAWRQTFRIRTRTRFCSCTNTPQDCGTLRCSIPPATVL